jgi:MFS superfamily sulfate permease-like transporter
MDNFWWIGLGGVVMGVTIALAFIYDKMTEPSEAEVEQVRREQREPGPEHEDMPRGREG